MTPIISIRNLTKRYPSGFCALKNIHLEVLPGEIFALLGPNGAGKTTLISTICGINRLSEGEVKVAGYDIVKDFRHTRSKIGLVPQELSSDLFQTVWNTVSFTRGLFGKPPNPDYIESLLKTLSLWEKKDSRLLSLSGGMKRRVLIAKALSHEPEILFLDEPTAGVDVDLRKDMWQQVRKLREAGTTIILTTHYLEEAEQMADRVGILNQGELILVEKKSELMEKLGSKQLVIELDKKLDELPEELSRYPLKLLDHNLVLSYQVGEGAKSQIAELFADLAKLDLRCLDLVTRESSLEEIFMGLVKS